MRERDKNQILLIGSLCCYFFTAASISIMPIECKWISEQAAGILLGTVFWVSALFGSFLQILFCKAIKKQCRGYRNNNGVPLKASVGIFSFMRTSEGVVADVVCVLSIVGFIIATVLTKGYWYGCSVFLSAFVFAFCMHCILNGKSYYCYKTNGTILKNIKKEN